MSTIPSLKPDLSNTFGAVLIGAFISAVFYGLTSLQTYHYYVWYPKDSKVTKLLVAIIWVLDTVHLAFTCYAIYYYLVINYFNPPALLDGHWSAFVSVMLNTVIGNIVQTYFVVQIFRLCKPEVRWWVASVLQILVVGHFAFGIDTVVFLFIKKELARIHEITFVASMPLAIFAVLSDILIAGSLCYLLHGSRTGFKTRTDTILTTLIIYAINRCLLTSFVAILETVLGTVLPHSLWFEAIDFFVGRLYANSLLTNLNSRASVLASTEGSIHSIHVSGLRFNGFNGTSHTKTERGDIVLDVRPSIGDPRLTVASRNIQAESSGELFGDKVSNNSPA